MKTRIHREKKEYLPELQVGKLCELYSPDDPTIPPLQFVVTEEYKKFYESVAKRTGLGFVEIIKETDRLFNGADDDQINSMLGVKDVIRAIPMGDVDVDGMNPEYSSKIAKKLSDLIIKNRCVD